MVTLDPPLKARDFLFACEELAMSGLPDGFPRPERHVEWMILQLHYGNPKVHLELQPMVSRGRIELGFHLEGPVEANDLWLAHLAAHADELAAGLGPEWELEEWTASWRRLHRVYPIERLTRGFAVEIGAEMAKALVVLQPIVEKGPDTRSLSAASTASKRPGDRNWRRKAKTKA